MLRIKITELCRSRGLTMKRLSVELEVEYQTVMYWNQGRAYPRLPMILRLAQFFSCSFEELIDQSSFID